LLEHYNFATLSMLKRFNNYFDGSTKFFSDLYLSHALFGLKNYHNLIKFKYFLFLECNLK